MVNPVTCVHHDHARSRAQVVGSAIPSQLGQEKGLNGSNGGGGEGGAGGRGGEVSLLRNYRKCYLQVFRPPQTINLNPQIRPWRSVRGSCAIEIPLNLSMTQLPHLALALGLGTVRWGFGVLGFRV